MNETRPGWWQASDGHWYPPELHPTFRPAAPPSDQGFAVAALVLSFVWLYGLGSLLAVIFANIQFSRDAAAGRKRNGMAVAGLVLGIIGLAITGSIVLMQPLSWVIG